MSPPCIHKKTVDRCVICGAYPRFLGSRKNTPATRREFWQGGAMATIMDQAMERRRPNS